mgnify:CR=1 FL=1
MATLSTAAPDPAHQRKVRRNLVILALVCIAPMLASYALYYLWRPGEAKNYGELLQTTPVPEIAQAADNGPFAALKGKWTLLMVDAPACAKPCADKLWQMRQLRLTQGKEMERMTRLWVVDGDGPPDAARLAEYEGTIALPAAQIPGLMRLLREGDPTAHLYVIDPLGNLMMRFPKDPDLNRVKKDLLHLLKVSRIG